MLIEELYMNLGQCIKKVREAKGLSGKQVATAAKMDNANYSRIENGKTDPTFSLVLRIAKALDVELHELFRADILFKETNSLNKSLQEKFLLVEQMDKKEKIIFYGMLDAFVSKKKLHDAFKSVIQKVEG
jgi:transcriptional regulator with XRE-family HTH domain